MERNPFQQFIETITEIDKLRLPPPVLPYVQKNATPLPLPPKYSPQEGVNYLKCPSCEEFTYEIQIFGMRCINNLCNLGYEDLG